MQKIILEAAGDIFALMQRPGREVTSYSFGKSSRRFIRSRALEIELPPFF